MLSRGVPLAQVTLASDSPGNVVNVEMEGGTAEVTLGHTGPVKLEAVPASAGLKVKLHQFDLRALALERYSDVQQALNEASWNGRDDLAEAVLKATSDEELARVPKSRDGQWALARLCEEVTSGYVSDEEHKQAQRVLRAWAQHVGLERFSRAVEDKRTKVFPVRKSGPTVRAPVSPAVRASPDGLKVSLSSKVAEYPEWQALKETHFHIPYDEVVGVRLYDAGGAVRYVPALFLVEVSNAEERNTLQKCGEMFALGLTLGLGGGAGAGGAAASTLAWCDRAAVGLGLLLSVVDDHRGEILERYGEEGARFLQATDVLASLVAFYGLGRVAVALPRAVQGLRQAYLGMKASKAALSSDEVLLGRIGHGVDELLDQAEKASKGGEVIPIERARKPNLPPAVEEQPLRATGTDVRLVPLGQQSAGPRAVASPGGGKPPTPLSPAAPSLQGTRPAGAGKASAPRPSTELGAAKGEGRAGRLWGTWDGYPKVTVGGREYAQIGERLYTRHAVERMMPRGLTTEGRSMSPNLVEDAIREGTSSRVVVDGVERTIFRSGSVEVVTEQGGKLVISVNPFKY